VALEAVILKTATQVAQAEVEEHEVIKALLTQAEQQQQAKETTVAIALFQLLYLLTPRAAAEAEQVL
jgi:hypothetical protein